MFNEKVFILKGSIYKIISSLKSSINELLDWEYTNRDNMDYILGNNHVLGFILKLNNFSK